jgi:nucleotide-binding universal stress UspA family protein
MTELPDNRHVIAVQHFQAARQRADLELLSARLTGRSAELLSFEEIRRRLKASPERGWRELRVIPLDVIVGSVGRYTDFTRSFLPLNENDLTRWASVRAAFLSQRGVPPIELFQVGDVYFVLDGNHRVSVARSLKLTEIEAYVTPIKTRVPLTADVKIDDLIITEAYATFLEQTRLDESHPALDFRVTEPCSYGDLLEFIEIYQCFLAQTHQHDIPFAEAAQVWCDEVYLPLVQLIRERGILENFPERTECDLTLWLARHREELSEKIGWDINPETAANDLVAQHSPRRRGHRLRHRVLNSVIPSPLTAGPAPGAWRAERRTSDTHHLFREILVPISEDEAAWRAVAQALVVAQREEGTIHGICVAKEGVDPTIAMLQSRFEAYCREHTIPATFQLHQGERVADTLRERGLWNDLMVLRLVHPPGALPVERLRSGFSQLVRTSSCPILAVPGDLSQLQSPLLAYDGTRKAQEALFVASYLAACWQLPLSVVTVREGRQNRAGEEARRYLESQGIEADFIDLQKRNLSVGDHILHTTWARQNDFIIMGGYGEFPMLDIARGSSVDTVLRHSTMPVLICR